MDILTFDIVKPLNKDYLTTIISVNGIDLRLIIGFLEEEQINPNNFCLRAGAYEGISPLIAFYFHNHFCKKTAKRFRQAGEHYTLYEYAYSEASLGHTLSCKIIISDDQVSWFDFKVFSNLPSPPFIYNDLSFCFDKKKYLAAIDDIKRKKLKTYLSEF